MDQIDCIAAVRSVAEAGWAYRDLLMANGPLTAEMVALEEALHELDQSLAKLKLALARLPPIG